MTGVFGKRIFFFNLALAELEEIREQVNTSCCNARVYLARGAEMQCWRHLMREFSAVLQFPDYFGWNRDAFSDCMADLGWLGEETICLLIKDYDVVLGDAAARQDFLNELEGDLSWASYWAAHLSGRRLNVYVFCQSRERKADITSVPQFREQVMRCRQEMMWSPDRLRCFEREHDLPPN